jgi:hypothetical protein
MHASHTEHDLAVHVIAADIITDESERCVLLLLTCVCTASCSKTHSSHQCVINRVLAVCALRYCYSTTTKGILLDKSLQVLQLDVTAMNPKTSPNYCYYPFETVPTHCCPLAIHCMAYTTCITL